MNYVNLKSIVSYIYEDDITSHPSPEERLEILYEKCRQYLLEIFNALDFLPDLIKIDGEYRIPNTDGPFIEWLINDFTSPKMKLVRKGQYYEAGPEYLYKFFIGLGNILIHLDVEEVKIQAQMEIMQKRTDYFLMVRLHNIRTQMMEIMNNLFQYVHIPIFNLEYDEKCKFLDTVTEGIQEFNRTTGKEFLQLIQQKEEEIKKTAYKISAEDFNFSNRTKEIYKQLNENEEYKRLMEQLENLENYKGFLKTYDKEKRKITNRIQEIFNKIIQNYPIEINNITEIEKIMYSMSGPFRLTHKGGEEGWYVIESDGYDF